MSDRIRMDFRKVKEMIAALRHAEEITGHLFEDLDGQRGKIVQDKLLDGKSGEALDDALQQVVELAQMLFFKYGRMAHLIEDVMQAFKK